MRPKRYMDQDPKHLLGSQLKLYDPQFKSPDGSDGPKQNSRVSNVSPEVITYFRVSRVSPPRSESLALSVSVFPTGNTPPRDYLGSGGVENKVTEDPLYSLLRPNFLRGLRGSAGHEKAKDF